MTTRISFLFCLLMMVPAVSQATDTRTIVVVLSSDDSLPIGQEFCEGDVITSTVGAELTLPDGSDIELEKNTQIRVSMIRPNSSSPVAKFHLVRGGIRAQVVPRRSQTFQITTPVSTAGVRGTDFSVEYDPAGGDHGGDAADVDVYDGTVDVTQSSTGASAAIPGGSGVSVDARRVNRRAVSEARREKWEDRRQETIDRLKARWNITNNGELADRIKSKLNNLSPARREIIRNRVRNTIDESRDRIQNRREHRGNVRDNAQEHRENVQQRHENRQERRSYRR